MMVSEEDQTGRNESPATMATAHAQRGATPRMSIFDGPASILASADINLPTTE